MRKHSNRTSYYMVGGEEVIHEPQNLFGGCPHLHGQPKAEAPLVPQYKFGRMFKKAAEPTAAETVQMIEALVSLGKIMNEPPGDLEIKDSNIPAGYTYLGQFLAHELTFDKTVGISAEEPDPINWRSPQIDLDSLYLGGPEHLEGKQLFEDDGATLRVGCTIKNGILNKPFPNDLFRDQEGNAQVGDERNDENLALAQTHVALVSFHNAVVNKIRPDCPPHELFKRARQEVRLHFQWIILNDYLPRIVDRKVLECVLNHGLRWFRVPSKEELFMPLEFSVAAFRLGHSMVRAVYEWNYHHGSKPALSGPPVLIQLFEQTKFSGNLLGENNLLSEWVIDWRRFYSFDGMDYATTSKTHNVARPINTMFDLHLECISGYPHEPLPANKRLLTVRNLLRGFALRLPTGEEVAREMGVTPLTRKQIVTGPHEEVLDTPVFWGRTPLWYYVLKEAEWSGGNHLGPVGSRIVAETLIGLIMHSPESIFHVPAWRPKYSNRKTASNEVRFEMVDLIDFAGVVNPAGPYTGWK